MASVDGSRSYLAGSDELIQHTCGPCKDDGETKEGKYLCEFCKVYLCFDCRNDHKTFKATKNHSIVSAHLTHGAGSTSSSKSTFTILCGCDQKRAVEIYCEKHDEVICPSCKTIKHRNCKISPIKDKVNTQKQLKDLMVKVTSLKAEMEILKQNEEANRTKLDIYKEECKKEITTFRREINTILDRMEKNTLESLDKTANHNLLAIEKRISDIKASLQALDTDFDIIDNANKTNRDEVMFSANVKVSKNISEYDDLIQDIRNDMQLLKLAYQKNKKLVDLLQSGEGLGRIELSEAGSSQQDHVVILDMKVKSTKEVDIKLPDDEDHPNITGCTFLSNGRILLCDNRNKKLKLLDSDMSVKKSLKLSDWPYDVAAVGDNEAIISFGNTKNNDLQYIHTRPDLKLGKKIKLPDKCYALQVVNDEIYTICHKDSGHDEIWRLDRAGNIMSKIILTQSSSGPSTYLGLCLAGPNPRVYLTDYYNARVSCFQLDGKMVYQYEDKELRRPDGIYVDSVGNSLVCGSHSHNIVVITADGRKHRELLSSKDITRPICIDYRPEDNTLIVGLRDNLKLFVYKLGM